MNNDTYFNKQSTSQSTSKNVVIYQLNELVLQSHATPTLSFVSDIFEEFKTNMTNIPPIELIHHNDNRCKHTNTVALQSKLFFNKTTLDNTLRQRRYIVHVALDATLELNKDGPTRYSYHCVFLTNHLKMQTRVTNLVYFGQNGICTHVVR